MRTLLLILIPIISFGQITPYGGKTNQTYIAGTLKLSDSKDQGFGTWSSLSTGIATVGSKSGVVTGVAQGSSSIIYTMSGVHDTLSVYVSTTDSSGYYFEKYSNFGQLQLRDCDGVTQISNWSGGFISATTPSIFGYVTYNKVPDIYQLIIPGVTSGLGTNVSIPIKRTSIKDFIGVAPKSTADSVLAQIQTSGF